MDLPQTPQQQPARMNFLNRITDHPVITKELKGRMRGKQGFIILGAYLSFISFFISLIYILIVSKSSTTIGDPSFLQTVGKVIFSTVVLLELLMLAFIGPALTAGAISSEREHRTLDLLKTSLLSPRSLVFGKLSSAVAFLFLLIFTGLPVESLAFFLGGVGAEEMIVSTLMLVVTAVFFCTLGLFFSSISQRTLLSTVFSYATILLSFILFIFLLFIIGTLGTINARNIVTENILTTATWFLLSLNPFFAAVISEVILIDEQSLWLTSSNLFGTTSFPLPSPWIIYVTFNLLLSTILIALSINFVKRTDR